MVSVSRFLPAVHEPFDCSSLPPKYVFQWPGFMSKGIAKERSMLWFFLNYLAGACTVFASCLGLKASNESIENIGLMLLNIVKNHDDNITDTLHPGGYGVVSASGRHAST